MEWRFVREGYTHGSVYLSFAPNEGECAGFFVFRLVDSYWSLLQCHILILIHQFQVTLSPIALVRSGCTTVLSRYHKR
jgi:hypothetical protein